MKRLLPIVFLTAGICFCSCRTFRVVEQVPVEVHDTISQKVFLHDSTFIDRWHTVEVKGDTIYVTDSVSVVKCSLITDTAYRYIERPVVVSKTETVEVKKPLAWWQKGLMGVGVLAMVLTAGWLVMRQRR